MDRSLDLPIFPLRTVLFPGGVLALRIFEQRYMGMARDCIRDQSSFGVCLIAEGNEVGEPALPHDIGSTARITEWDMAQLGVLQVSALGGQRFRILDKATDRQGLIRARVERIAAEPVATIPDDLRGLVPLLQAIASDLGDQRMPVPHAFDDAVWVGYRYAEVLPIQPLARQKLLELGDPLARLKIIHAYLMQHRLIE